MHRSGTSAITRGLATLGCTLGDTLIEAIPGVNDKGFWEDVDINTFNQTLLEQHGSDWYRCAQLPADYFQAPPLRVLRQEACGLLVRKLRQGTPLALKEPRLTILLPFWQTVFAELGLQVGYVHVVRHPLEVAQSLLVRDGFSLARSLLLWWFYNVAALRYIQEHPHVVVHYDEFLEDPGCQLQRIAVSLQLPNWDAQAPETRLYLEEFLDPALRHSELSDDTLATVAPDNLVRLYRLLRALSRDEDVDAVVLAQIASFTADVRLHQALIEELEAELAAKEQSLQAAARQNVQYQQAIVDLEAKQEATNQEWALHLEDLEQKSCAEREDLQRTLEGLVTHRDQLQQELNAMLASKSWRWTRFLREGRLWLHTVRGYTRQAALSPLRRVRRRMPLPLKTSARVRTQIRPPERVVEVREPVPIPCRKTALALQRPVRMIAFHLPQYHETPENNQWWGKGFTEWANVQPAQPQFPGHYQPHIPLQGYYDLTDPRILPRQAELARRYGIEGFCFYFYWFNGHRLLERPLQMLIDHPEWEIPFCLCWANENWTRRWDGLDQEILIGQEHSEADDHAFITYLERYLSDPRYIRIDSRPLLLLYRPDLLPDAAATIGRWREHCRNVGIGEIFVAYPQSFEARDPHDYGMDAAIEFPPNNSAPPEHDSQEFGCRENFTGHLYDWSVFPDRAAHYTTPDYPLFRGLNPGWDNTPRRNDRATIFVHSDPAGYQQWAVRACEDSIERIPDRDARMIFINAWNEWGEGAHLEPDVRYGCAYLEATDMAQICAAVRTGEVPQKSSRIAIVIHAYYPDVLHEILPYLQQLDPAAADLWITTPEDRREVVERLLQSIPLRVTLRTQANRGRDVLPFLRLLPEILAADYGYVLKLHTKKSLHRADGDAWCRAFYASLLDPQNLQQNRERMEQDASVGMLAPKDYVVPMGLFWGSNARQSLFLAKRMGIPAKELNTLHFVAGTMFFCRWETLLPLWALQLQAEDFEEELGQVDGTLAHAVERAFGMACFVTGKTICAS